MMLRREERPWLTPPPKRHRSQRLGNFWGVGYSAPRFYCRLPATSNGPTSVRDGAHMPARRACLPPWRTGCRSSCKKPARERQLKAGTAPARVRAFQPELVSHDRASHLVRRRVLRGTR